jgi:spore maturation protein CgeB
MMNLLEKNLSVLRQRQPETAGLIAGLERSPEVELRATREGLPVHRYRGKLLHSEYDPLREAKQCTEGFHEAHPWIIGFGDAYHLEALLKNCRTEDMVVVEPDGGLLRAVLEDRDLGHVLEKTHVLVEEPPARIAEKIPKDSKSWYIHPPSKQIHRRFLEALQALSSYRSHEQDRLRILVVGPVYGGSYPIACHVKAAFEDLGHTVSFVDLAAFYPGYRELEGWDTGNSLLRPFEQLLSQLIERRAEGFSPDAIVVLAQAPICGESLKRIRGKGTPVAYWFVEDYRRMPYWKRLAPATDAFFVIQREARDAIRAAGAPFVRYLPLAAQPDVHRPCRLSTEEIERYGSSVSFVGAGYKNRRNFLARLASPGLKIWGNEWDGSPSVVQEALQEGGRRVSTEETVKIFNASRINLNVHSSTYHEAIDPHGDFVNPRTFEIAACGGFQIVDKRSLLPEVFTEQEIVVYEDLKDGREKIHRFLDRKEDRRAFAEKARRRVLMEHTYSLRMKELLGTLYELGMEGDRRETGPRESLAESCSPELREYLAPFSGRSLPELEEVVAMIGEKRQLSPEDRVFLTLMAFKEEAGCRISSW